MCLNLSQTCVVLLQSEDEVQETRKRRRSGITDPNSWKSECRQLIETMLRCEDSEPFRRPVGLTEITVCITILIKSMVYP